MLLGNDLNFFAWITWVTLHWAASSLASELRGQRWRFLCSNTEIMRVAPLAALVALPAPLFMFAVSPRSLHQLCVLRLNSCGDLSEVFCRIDQSALFLSAKLICMLSFKEVSIFSWSWCRTLNFTITIFKHACSIIFQANILIIIAKLHKTLIPLSISFLNIWRRF